jgi:hypothetical protein
MRYIDIYYFDTLHTLACQRDVLFMDRLYCLVLGIISSLTTSFKIGDFVGLILHPFLIFLKV